MIYLLEENIQCSKCRINACVKNEPLNVPKFCPVKTRDDVLDTTLKHYLDDPDDQQIMAAAASTEIEGLTNGWTRIEDVINFANEMEYDKLGIATCMALISESAILTKILENKGFEVVSICCKYGSMFNENIGLDDGKFKHDLEIINNPQIKVMANPQTGIPLCNPVGQAFLLNGEKTELNILLGLCVGHDALFIQHSEAPVTPLIVKDRQTLHNPAAAIYGSNFYFSRLMSSKTNEP